MFCSAFPSYTKLTDSDEETSREVSNTDTARPHTITVILAALCGLLLGVLGTAAAFRLDTGQVEQSYEAGFTTDYAPARSAIRLQSGRFHGTAKFHENGTAYVDDTATSPYVGPPSPQLDFAWDTLVLNRYFSITEDEAREAWGSDYQQYYKHPVDGYMAGLDVFHTLHCLNVLRKAAHPEYYNESTSPIPHFQRYHLDHCADIIRQSLQCHADLTPIPIRYFEGIHRPFIDSDQVHTCRNFSMIQARARELYWEGAKRVRSQRKSDS